MAIFRYIPNKAARAQNLERLPKVASTAYTENTLVTLNASGQITPALVSSVNIVGIVEERVTAADSNYADNSNLGYDEIMEGDRFIADIDSTAGVNVGDEKAINNAGQVRGGSVGADQPIVRILGILPSNKVIVTFKTFTNKS